MSPKRDARHLVRPHLAAMAGYKPMDAIDVVAQNLGLRVEQIVKLDGNENPYGPSPKVAEALRDYGFYHLYPDPEQRRVREAVAEYVGADPSQIVLGNGSDDLLNICAMLFLSPGDTLVNAPPTFGVYSYLGHVFDANTVQIERNEDFSLDLPALERALDKGGRLLFIASPNNPTGNSLPRDQLERLLTHDAMIVVDEAYAEFTGESFVPLVAEHDNLIVVRTFSKWAGLAGLRAGYGVFPPSLAEIVWNTKVPFNLTVTAEQAILASLEDREWLQKNISLIIAERERLFSRLSDLPWLRPYPSHGNFILCEVRGLAANEVRDRLAEQGIMIRYFDVPGLRNCIRVSVGKPEHTDRVIEALKAMSSSPQTPVSAHPEVSKE
jgi:histidinol-phosphate aminotransferase